MQVRRSLHPGRGLAFALGTLLLAGCADREVPTLGAPGAGHSASRAVADAREDAAVDELTRLVALAMSDVGLRQRVKQDMRAAPYREHKLHFSRYVRGESGGILLAKMVQVSGKRRAEVLDLLQSVRPLEFYMPVPAHRASWRGSEDLLVTGSMVEERDPIAYTPKGERIVLSIAAPPTTPTFVLVPVEPGFEKPIDLRKALNVDDQNGETIGTLCTECQLEPIGDGSGGGTSSGLTQQRGIGVQEWITHMKTPNDHEPWLKGAPEFKLFVAGTTVDGTPYKETYLIPEYGWAGSDDGDNAKWRDFRNSNNPYGIKFILWDADLGNRMGVGCKELDGEWFNATLTVQGTSEFKISDGNKVSVGYKAEWKFDDTDDECGEGYVPGRKTTGEWYYMADGKDDDFVNPNPRFMDGVSDLHWHGLGIQH